MIPLPPHRLDEVRDFLRTDLAGAMFPLLNLSGRGLAIRSWLAERDRRIAAYLGLTANGMIQPFAAPGADPGIWGPARAALAGTPVSGLIGRPGPVAALRAALGLETRACRLDKAETGMELDLAALAPLPDDGTALIAPGPDERALLTAWRAAYEIETLGTPPETAATAAAATVAGWLKAGSHRLLVRDGTPLALTGFNADLGETVQIGGVYVPPENRNQGLARRAVAGHLAEARARGVRHAVLFASGPAAMRAYRAVGFELAGEMRLTLFKGPQEITP